MITRPFNNAYVDGNDFIKVSKSERLFEEINYYYKIQDLEQKNLFAEFKGDVSDPYIYGLRLKHYHYKNLYESLIDGIDPNEIFSAITHVLESLHHQDFKQMANSSKGCNNTILIEKTEKEFAIFRKQPNIFLNHFINKNLININGVDCLHFDFIWPIIKNIIKIKFLEFNPTVIHGDLCFANILWDSNNKKCILIDPRGSYQIKGIYGDPDYDFAKLMHSLNGCYEQIIYNHYEFKVNENLITFKFKNDFEFLKNKLINYIDKNKIQKIKLIEGLLFISMSSRHYNNEEHQFIMYCTGLKILNQFIKENQSNF
jgi:hypothetical protein